MLTVRTIVSFEKIYRLIIAAVAISVCLAQPKPNGTDTGKGRTDGTVCVINSDCLSDCCVYANAVSGRCMPRAPIGQVCGYVLYGGSSIGDHYRLCETCDTFCCCGVGCCPTSYCVAALQLRPVVCANCNTGCCCTDEICCPVQYCATAPGLHEIQGEPCQRCPSGCCCGDSCCLSNFCKGSIIGQYCDVCGSGCCCGNLCCAVSFCDRSNTLSLTRLLALYGGAPALSPQLSYSQMTNPMDPGSALPPMASMNAATKPDAWRCSECTTGCCCYFGCCNNIYC